MHTKPIKTPQTNSLTSTPIVETTEEKSALRAKSVKEYTIKKWNETKLRSSWRNGTIPTILTD